MSFNCLVRATCSALLLTSVWVPVIVVPAASANEITIAQAQSQNRLRVAVLDFDFAATTSVLNAFGGFGPSDGISDRLTNQLTRQGAYVMIERSRINAILAEQGLAAAGLVDANTAAQIGRMLGADIVILGSVTRFNVEEGRSGVGILGIGSSNRRVTAEVQLTARMVNTTTGEILAVAEGAGDDTQRNSGFSLGGLVRVGSSTSNVDELLSNAADTAVEQLASNFQVEATRLAALPPALPNIEARVADVAGREVVINRGSQDGFRVGMTISIERVTRQVTDPETGEVLRTLSSPVGEIELTDVDDRSSMGRVTTGTGFRVGDRAIAVR
ncbi:penicillin-binding protein activator LpoB [Oscillatoria sp. FACHB-1407]|uniref:CsgG/HfaB family protein n=1 Tax=Oscillatoria sp. FACHB-1407 TaxID=2692847 RepID=UPI00168563A9|nr:CsgG/HfaB family protein [Oscillatoria sp. FACHB-1407]MBD2464534.1 penicillin-binding protein activator LpoB [Oscillatoria sp. FACHB-1407]